MATRALFVGVNDYRHPKIRNLAGARRDAEALWALFVDTVPGVEAELLVDTKATFQAVYDGIRDLRNGAVGILTDERAKLRQCIVRHLRLASPRVTIGLDVSALAHASHPAPQARRSDVELLRHLLVRPITTQVGLYGALTKVTRCSCRHPSIRSHLQDQGDRIPL